MQFYWSYVLTGTQTGFSNHLAVLPMTWYKKLRLLIESFEKQAFSKKLVMVTEGKVTEGKNDTHLK